jgi:hypothetical protein
MARSNHSGQFLRELYELYTNTAKQPFRPFEISFYGKLMADLGVKPGN